MTYLLAGLGVTVVVAQFCAVVVDPGRSPFTIVYENDWWAVVEAVPGAERVTVTRPSRSWGPMQAAGPPDTPTFGDHPTAWAPKSVDGSPEWLQLTYDRPLRIRSIEVHETFRPGALTRVALVTDAGREVVAWSGVDPTPSTLGGGVSHIPVQIDPKNLPAVRKVKLYQGVPAVPGWNEIDAVGAVDEAGVTHWATSARASSFYGQPPATGGTSISPPGGLPAWSRLDDKVNGDAPTHGEVFGADARGWPMLALWQPLSAATWPAPSAPGSPGLAPTSTGGLTIGGSFGVLSPAVPAPSRRREVSLPWRPIWLGLMVDSLCFGAAIALLGVLLVRPRRFLVEVSRMKRGCCVRCGYDLGYDFPRGCPECGWRRGSSGSQYSAGASPPDEQVDQLREPHRDD